MGIPQNGFLSVYLKINSIVDVIRSSSEKFLLVDDFFICYLEICMAAIERQLQLCLNKVGKLADENGYKFSRAETVCIL